MRTLTEQEIDQVGGGVDEIVVAGVTITGVTEGLALQSAGGAVLASFGAGYAVGTGINYVYEEISGDSLGTDLYQLSSEQSW
jgi:hypothetical protein